MTRSPEWVHLHSVSTAAQECHGSLLLADHSCLPDWPRVEQGPKVAGRYRVTGGSRRPGVREGRGAEKYAVMAPVSSHIG